MQKKIIALAIAAAFAAPAAFADTSNVTVYGVANVSYDMTKTGSAVAATSFSSNKVSSNTSRLGLKGTEDLGDGLSAIWQIESLVNIDNSNAAGNTIGSRNTFAGLSSKTAGTVLLGRHDTPYNLSNRKYDLFADGMADNRSIMGGGRSSVQATTTTAAIVNTVGASFNGRQPEVIAYISPAFNGLTGAIAYVAGAETQTLASQTKGSAWSLAALYGNGPISANFGYETHTLGSAGSGTLGFNTGTPVAASALAGLKETAWTISGGYKVEAFELNAIYEKTSDNFGVLAGTPGTNVLGHRAYYLSGKYNVSANDAVKLAYANAGSNASVNTGATQISLGYDHSLSKRTTVYAAYTKLSNDTVGVYVLSGNGTGAPTVGGAGAKPSAISLGMKHTF
ncbi:MAG: porin [Gallionella sp.]|nr:porin [Gallionella sp.]